MTFPWVVSFINFQAADPQLVAWKEIELWEDEILEETSKGAFWLGNFENN